MSRGRQQPCKRQGAAQTRLSASCTSDSQSSSSSSAGGTYAAGKVAASQRAEAGAKSGSGALPGDARISSRLVHHGSLTGQMRAVQRHASLSTRSAQHSAVAHLARHRRHAHTPACVGWRTTAARRCRRCRLLRDAVSTSCRQRSWEEQNAPSRMLSGCILQQLSPHARRRRRLARHVEGA